MVSKARKEFFNILGKNYERYSYPTLCGWIEALMLLEPKDWTQREISLRLSEIFPDPDYSTSISSVNRALKVLEDYGAVMKSGSRKIGYTYQLAPSSKMLTNMFTKFIDHNDSFIKDLSFLKENEDLKGDSILQKGLNIQLKGARMFSEFLKGLLESID